MDSEQNQEQQQKRGFVDNLNRTVSSAQRVKRRYGRGVALNTVRKQAVKRGAVSFFVFLFSNPIGWILLLIILIIFIVVLILLVFTGNTTANPLPAVDCTTVSGAACVSQGTTCPIVNGNQTSPDASGTYTCTLDSQGNNQTCCLPPSQPGYFIPPFACGQSYWGWTYYGHTPYAVDWNQYGNKDDGDPVRAEADGVVVKTINSYGQVNIKHAGGYMTVYAHMVLPLEVKEGQRVVVGQLIGHIDNTAPPGGSSGSHLHLGHYLNGVPIKIVFYGNKPYPNSLSPSVDTPPGPYVGGSCP